MKLFGIALSSFLVGWKDDASKFGVGSGGYQRRIHQFRDDGASNLTPNQSDRLYSNIPDPVLLSTPSKCNVSANTKGFVGCRYPDVSSVVLADDMQFWACFDDFHWIQLDWSEPVFITQVRLDWEVRSSSICE
jgi:hypothetical protein